MDTTESTTVRTENRPAIRVPSPRARRAFGALDRVAPAVAGRLATRVWFTLPPAPKPGAAPRAAGTPFDVEVLGATVRGTVWGDGDAGHVYLVHGWAGTAAQMHPWVDPLVEAGRRVVTFDALGHGTSDPDPSGRRSATIPHMATALRAVVEQQGPAEAVIAHSLGALVTGWALRGGLPVGRLVLIAPMTEAVTYARQFVTVLGGTERTYRRLAAGIRRRAGVDISEIDLTALPAGASRPPLLVVHDRTDRQTALAGSTHLVETWPEAQLMVTRGLGHHRILRDAGVLTECAGFVVATDPAPARH